MNRAIGLGMTSMSSVLRRALEIVASITIVNDVKLKMTILAYICDRRSCAAI